MKIPGFSQLLASFPRPNDRLGYEGTWRERAVKLGLVPIYSDWVISYAVDEEGQVIATEDDEGRGRTGAVTDIRQRHIVLAWASRGFPELAQLQPLRGPKDPVCPSCKGAGGVAQYPDLICECGNLGWIPAGSALEHR
jgi:hypothetical protein